MSYKTSRLLTFFYFIKHIVLLLGNSLHTSYLPSCSFSLNWSENWKRSPGASRRRSASTCSWSSRAKVSRRTLCSRHCPTTAARATAPAQARPPTAPRPPTHRRPTTPSGTRAWTISSPRPPLLLCQMQTCLLVKVICK